MVSDLQWTVRAVAPADEASWRELYRGYRRFYEVPDDEGALDVVWDWIHDEAHELSCFVVADPHGTVGGLAHVRPFARPLGASTGLYLDDLYVDPDLRGGGLGSALLQFLSGYATEHGFGLVRWITAEDNTTARALYDSVATAGPWVTYDMPARRPSRPDSARAVRISVTSNGSGRTNSPAWTGNEGRHPLWSTSKCPAVARISSRLAVPSVSRRTRTSPTAREVGDQEPSVRARWASASAGSSAR